MSFEKSDTSGSNKKNPTTSADPLVNKLLIEQKIVDQLFALINTTPTSETLFSQSITLLLSHPLLAASKICLWKKTANMRNAIISNQTDCGNIADYFSLNCPKQPENQNVRFNTEKLETQTPTDKEQINIFFHLENSDFYCASLMLFHAEKTLQDIRDFLCRFFYIMSLYLDKEQQNHQQTLLNTLLEYSQQAINITDTQAVIQYVNPAFSKITGYSAEESIGKTIHSLFHSDDVSSLVFADIKKKLSQGKVWKGQYSTRRKNGGRWLAEATIIPIKDNTGKVIQNIAIKQDITSLTEQLHQKEQSEERYFQILNAVSDAVIIHDAQGNIIQTNSMACLKLGYSHDELKHLSIFDLEIALSPEFLKDQWLSMSSYPVTTEGIYRSKDGRSFPVEIRTSLSDILHQKLYIAIARDISLRQQHEAEIQRLASALEQSPIPILIIDKFGQIVYSSNKMNKLTAYSKTELKGKNISILLAVNKNDYHQIWKSLASNQEWQGEMITMNKYGHPLWVSLIVSLLKNKFGTTTHYQIVMEDITHQKNEQMALKHKANYDQMTNLPNNISGRYRLEQSLMAAKELKEKVAVLFIDLDRFKPVNDLYGHHIGDMILKKVSKILLNSVRTNDFVGRYGGDEFIIILGNIKNKENAVHIAQKCIQAITEPMEAENNELQISASIGIALFPEHAKTAVELIKKADKAMYVAKKNNSHLQVYSSNMGLEDFEEKNLRPQFNKAISKHLFQLHYQPIMDIHSKKIVAAEALLRWDSEWSGQIKPEKVLELAKESGQLDEVEQWIIKRACIEAKRLQRMFSERFHIHVNVTAHQLINEQFIELVKQALNNSCLNPNSLVLEFREDILLEYPEITFNQLKKLASLGVRCCIDRFSLSLSSINYIKTIPFNCIKIDKKMMHDLEENKHNQESIKTIIKFSNEKSFEVVADGIENKQQLEMLKNLGCGRAQGWYIADAMPPENFIEWMKNRS